MKTKPKKLSARAGRKEMTGINLAALKREIKWLKEFYDYLDKRVTKLEREK